jgi:hypothetical protein
MSAALLRFRLSLAVALCASALCVHALRGAESFTLQAVRTERVFGPYLLQDGERAQVDGQWYQMRIVPPDRLSFISLASGRVFGPVQTIEGRLIEVNGQMYAFSWRVGSAVPAPAAPAAATRELPPPLPPPPPRPASIPIPPLASPTPPRPRTPLPAPSTEWHAVGWLAPFHDSAIDWKVDGKRGRQSDLSRTTIGGAMSWHGWTASLGLSPSVSGGTLLPYGMDVTEAELDDGTGWSMSLGYRRPLLRQGRWEATGGGRISLSQDKLDLKSTTAVGYAGTNATLDVVYESESSSVTVTELALWLDVGLSYSQEWWGLFANLSLQPLGSIDVEGGLNVSGQKLAIDAERSQPLAFGFGAWAGVSPWRGFADFTVGTESSLRIGVMYDF